MESCFFTTYRIPEINLHNFIHLRLLNFKGPIDLEDVKILVNSKGVYAEIIASVEGKFNYWFVELKLFNTEVDHEMTVKHILKFNCIPKKRIKIIGFLLHRLWL
ncbi:hypothetical protein BANRA_04104 [Acinetobacter baumannii]|nr:hypothetical protein BANRA_04104 [Acinetobacter baumannii]